MAQTGSWSVVVRWAGVIPANEAWNGTVGVRQNVWNFCRTFARRDLPETWTKGEEDSDSCPLQNSRFGDASGPWKKQPRAPEVILW